MIEPPSRQLVETLSGLGLCTPGDLRRCRPHVRKLAYDLPAFDSIWIDALVHRRKLSHFQAQQLESGDPERLRVGPCLIIRRLGRGAAAETFLARRQKGHERCVLKLIDCPIELRASRLEALEQVVERLEAVRHPSLVAPNVCLQYDDRLAIVSRYVPGPNLSELLIRRGRFAAENVVEIGRQLVNALATLAEHDCTHGEINLWNVRLTSGGVAVLVDAGVSPAVSPELSIHARRPPERYDGTAPELIGTGSPPTTASDLYALGCLLWHLLAGRPPFTTGDPLAKLAAHQTRTIDDVRQWAPDTPAFLAETIAALTARLPQERPSSLADVAEKLGLPGRRGRRTLSRFHADFSTAARRNRGGHSSGAAMRWTVLLLLLLAISGVVLGLFDRGARSDPLSLPSRVVRYLQRTTAGWVGKDETPGNAPQRKVHRGGDGSVPPRQLPVPDADGVILLDSDGPYFWRPIDVRGPLTIRGKRGRHPQVVVTKTPCLVIAETLRLENVHFRRRPSEQAGNTSLSALLLLQTGQLTVEGCSFQTHEVSNPTATDEMLMSRPVAIAWRPLVGQDSKAGRIAIHDTLFAGHTTAVFLAKAPASIDCRNCAKIGGGAFFSLAEVIEPGQLLKLSLRQMTLRRVECLLKWRLQNGGEIAGYVVVQADDCLFDLAGPAAALFQFFGRNPIDPATTRIEWTGAGSLAQSGLVESIRINSDGEATALTEPAVVVLEGITTGPFTFAGPLGTEPRDSRVSSSQVPRRSQHPPGIDATRLAFPVWGNSKKNAHGDDDQRRRESRERR